MTNEEREEKTYRVTIPVTGFARYTVKAVSKEDAIEKAAAWMVPQLELSLDENLVTAEEV